MTIDPLLQARLLLGAFLCGLGVGCLFDCGTLLSVFLGAYCPPPFCAHLYARKLPVIGRAVGCGISRVRGAWSRVLRCLGTFLLPVTAAVCLLLLLFSLYRGVFRIGAPLCMLLGFALWRTYISLPIARVICYMCARRFCGRFYLCGGSYCVPSYGRLAVWHGGAPHRFLLPVQGGFAQGSLLLRQTACCPTRAPKRRHAPVQK